MELEKPKIGGWLHLIRIILWLEAVVYPLALIGFIMFFAKDQSPYNGFNLVQGLISLVAIIYVLRLFHKRKSSFVKWNIILEIYIAVVDIVSNVLAPHFNYGQLTGEIIVVALYIWYLSVSKRVKETFIF